MERRAQGCITVEMECATVAAVTRFRRVQICSFLFTADNLLTAIFGTQETSMKGINGYDIYMNGACKTRTHLENKLRGHGTNQAPFLLMLVLI